MIHVSVSGRHSDGLVACGLLDHLQADSGLGQPRTKCMTEIMPAKLFDLGILEGGFPPFLVIPDTKHHIFGRAIRAIAT